HDAIDAGVTGVVEIKVPESWKNATDVSFFKQASGDRKDLVNYVNTIQNPVGAFDGNSLPVSTFKDYADGVCPTGSAAYEKRGIAVDVPEWNIENCIQCNFCAYVCPHAAIRPVAMTDAELKAAPKGTKAIPMTGVAGMNFAMTVTVMDCTGCGSCANICPGKKGNKALTMKGLETQLKEQEVFAYGTSIDEKPEVAAKFAQTSVKGSQFKQPLLEFSGACAGCGETPYAKLVTQLFGERMYISNATGCSSIWGGSAPSTPYTIAKSGFGPAWGNSLFEDNAEFGYGMFLAQSTIRNKLIRKIEALAVATKDKAVKAAAKDYLDTKTDGVANRPATDKLIDALTKDASNESKEILTNKDYLAKKSIWIFGGDGWAYDIGFGGVDHVLASGEDVNILVFDTEVYSNTGGQASKSTPTGAIAQFAAAGKEVKKKDLAAIAMSYGYIYVAQCAQGADYNQTIKAFVEAESYNGPSLVICYAPCINHGIKTGMATAQNEEKKAVTSGYWHNFRFDPRLVEAGKNPFQLDSKEPTESYKDFIMGEVRYNSLARANPERAEVLFTKAEANAKIRYEELANKAK
ncbi:MAG: thiamine pyrophosphate-dependent enzyme, partial [Oscillospiraceae bacterium]